MPRYINPYTDFGFKKLFGEEANKILLIDFLNQVLPAHHQIRDLEFKKLQNLPELAEERSAFFDIHCEALSGEKFIVEMQKARMRYFKDRSLYYVTFPIREQSQKGEWNFYLKPIYFVAILDFEHDESEERLKKFRRDVSLKDQDGDVFYDKLHFKFLQMPLFNKTEDELETRFDKWCYFLKNLESFEHIPAILNEPVFKQAFATAEFSNLSREEKDHYERSRLKRLEVKTIVQEAKEEAMKEGREEGREEGRQENRIEIARKMILAGSNNDFIAQITGLSIATIEELRKIGS